MQLKNFLPFTFGAIVSAQSLTDVLASHNASLSSFTSLLATNPNFLSVISSVTNITILAPNNNALSNFLNSSAGASAATDSGLVEALLSYHVLNGSYSASDLTNRRQPVQTVLSNQTYTNVTGGQVVGAVLDGTRINILSGLLAKSTVVTVNLQFTGGLLHIIDKVLTIPEADSATAIATNLTSLNGALKLANLIATFDSLRDVTIFAPSNAAFQAIGSAVSSLSNAQLSSILSYHVIQGTVGYTSLLSDTTFATVDGATVEITILNGDVFVNSAKVITSDILVANGVLHIIDSVLNPNNTSAKPNPSTTSAAFPGASSVSSTPFTSGGSRSTSSGQTPSPTSTAQSHSSGLSPGAKGGIGAGAAIGFLGFLALIIAVVLLRRGRKGAQYSTATRPTQAEADSNPIHEMADQQKKAELPSPPVHEMADQRKVAELPSAP